jgi:hypothetical protein
MIGTSRRISRLRAGVKERSPLNNNRGNNNRRRGRGNNRPQGGGQQLNRIDSRARGNAPQMLEKYKKLAHDAHLNGDRVNAEYYLQFADHYFRVIADTRVRQEESRGPRNERDERSEGQDGDYGNDFDGDNQDFHAFDQPPQGFVRRDREDRQEQPRRERPATAEVTVKAEEAPQESEPVEDNAERSPYEPPENPFVRPTRGLRPRREDRRPRSVEPTEETFDPVTPSSMDPSVLPPAIAAGRADDEEPAPRRRGRPRKKPVDDSGEPPLEAVG